jgi:hypothetical protein
LMVFFYQLAPSPHHHMGMVYKVHNYYYKRFT